MPRFYRSRFRGGSRRRRNWQFVRVTANDTTVVTPPAFYQEDLLLNFRQTLGISVQLPEITIWRLRIKISAKINWIAAPAAQYAAGFITAVFTDDISFTLQSAGTNPYSEKYMYYAARYYSDAVMMGERAIAANNTDYLTTDWIDVRAHRRLGNINDTLILQVVPTGSDVATMGGISWSAITLLKIGR